MRRPPIPRRRLRAVAPALVLGATAVAATLSPHSSGIIAARHQPSAQRMVTAASTSGSDPLRGLVWGKYTGTRDPIWPAYQSATGARKQLLARIAQHPLVHWFGTWNTNDNIEQVVRDYIANETLGHPHALVQMAIFRLAPWEGPACTHVPTVAEQASYRQYVDRVAAAIGSTHVALVLQPDLPFTFCVPAHRDRLFASVTYAARKFSSLPHTSVYIDAGAQDWHSVSDVVWMLRKAGVAYARGFALNATHYDSTAHQIGYGAEVVAGLARHGVAGKHFVISTVQNGRPFTYQQYDKRYPNGDFNRAATCSTAGQRQCVTLGIPPTADVTNPKWGLAPRVAATAGRLVDAYLWIGRPWLNDKNFGLDMNRTLAIARTTPYASTG